MVDSETQEYLNTLQRFRDECRQEQSTRDITGRRFDPDYLKVSDDQLATDIEWYVNKIEDVLEPFENGTRE